MSGLYQRLFGNKVVQLPAAQTKKEPYYDDRRELPAHGEVRKIHLGLIVGHTESEPGAKMLSGLHEYAFNSEVAKLAEEYALTLSNIMVSIIKRDNIGIKGAYEHAHNLGCDAVIELHFNEFQGSVQGSEILCSFDGGDVDFAHTIQSMICSVFERDGLSRGVKCIPRSARGAYNIYSFPEGVNCLVEPFFGDNEEDCAKAQRVLGAYAKGLVDASVLWAKKKDLI